MVTGRKRIKIGTVFLLAIMIVWAIITIYPLFWTVISSLKTNTEIFVNTFALPGEYHFEHYSEAFFKANMGRSILNSLIIASSTTVLVIILASLASFVLARFRFKWINIVYILFIVGIMIPIQSTMIPLVRTMGAINGTNNYPIIILLFAAWNLPISVFLITGYFKGIPRELDEAALIDGASPFSLLTRIFVPIAAPAISTAGILTFLFTYNDLIFSLLFITRKNLYTVPIALLSFVGYRSVDYGPTFASVIISIAPMMIIYLLFQERVQAGLSAGAVKQ